MKKILLNIEGMHCSSCAMSIDFDLEDLKGINEARTNYAKQKCEVEFNENKITIEEVLKQVQKTGYKAELTK